MQVAGCEHCGYRLELSHLDSYFIVVYFYFEFENDDK